MSPVLGAKQLLAKFRQLSVMSALPTWVQNAAEVRFESAAVELQSTKFDPWSACQFELNYAMHSAGGHNGLTDFVSCGHIGRNAL